MRFPVRKILVGTECSWSCWKICRHLLCSWSNECWLLHHWLTARPGMPAVKSIGGTHTTSQLGWDHPFSSTIATTNREIRALSTHDKVAHCVTVALMPTPTCQSWSLIAGYEPVYGLTKQALLPASSVYALIGQGMASTAAAPLLK
jgi:hypothetical protein